MLSQSLLDALNRLARQRHLVALRDGIISAVPLILVGSTFLLLGLQGDTIKLLAERLHAPGILGWPMVVWYRTNTATLLVPYRFTMGMLSPYVAFTVAASLARAYNLPPLPQALGACATFMMTIMPRQVEFWSGKKALDLPLEDLGAGSLFLAILCALGTVELAALMIGPQKPVDNDSTEDEMGVPRAVGDAFRSFAPMLIAVTIVWLLRHVLGIDLLATLKNVMKPAEKLGDSLLCVIVVNLALHVLQFAGVHGVAVINAVFLTFWQSWLAANADAHLAGQPLPHVTAYPFYQWFVWIGGAGASLPAAVTLLFSRNKHTRHIGRIALLPSIFNVNEPLIFGLPIVLNPALAIPFVLAPVVCGFTAYWAIAHGWVSRPFIEVPWVLPCFLGAPLSTGDSRALLLLGLNFLTSAAIWYPFIRAYERGLARQDTRPQA